MIAISYINDAVFTKKNDSNHTVTIYKIYNVHCSWYILATLVKNKCYSLNKKTSCAFRWKKTKCVFHWILPRYERLMRWWFVEDGYRHSPDPLARDAPIRSLIKLRQHTSSGSLRNNVYTTQAFLKTATDNKIIYKQRHWFAKTSEQRLTQWHAYSYPITRLLK